MQQDDYPAQVALYIGGKNTGEVWAEARSRLSRGSRDQFIVLRSEHARKQKALQDKIVRAWFDLGVLQKRMADPTIGVLDVIQGIERSYESVERARQLLEAYVKVTNPRVVQFRREWVDREIADLASAQKLGSADSPPEDELTEPGAVEQQSKPVACPAGRDAEISQLLKKNWTARQIATHFGRDPKTISNRIGVLRHRFGPEHFPYKREP